MGPRSRKVHQGTLITTLTSHSSVRQEHAEIGAVISTSHNQSPLPAGRRLKVSFQKPWKGDAPPALPNLMWDVYLGLIPCRRVGLDAQASTSSDLRDGCVIGMLAWKTQVPRIFASYLARFAPCPPMAPANLARDLAWWKKKGNRVLRSHLRWWHHTPQCHLVLPLPPLPLFTLPVLCLSQASQSGVQLHSRNKFVVWGRREWEGWGERGTKKK